jgi:hypothetical protein
MESKLQQLEVITKTNEDNDAVKKLLDEIIPETKNLFPLLSHEVELLQNGKPCAF